MAQFGAMTPGPRIPLLTPISIASFFLLGVVCLTLSAVPLRSSHDEWWHLKTGRWIEENGLPENDIFTYTAADTAWHNHEWLAQVLLWRVFKRGELGGGGGIRAVILFKALWITGAFIGMALFMARWSGAPALSALAAAVACALARRTLYPRPPFLTYGLLALVLIAFLAWRSRRLPAPWLLILVPIFALWANLHGGWLAGLVVAGAFWVEAGVGWGLAAWRLEDPREARREFFWLSAVLGLSAAATLATPYGYQVWAVFGRVMSDPRLQGIIFELQPANWRFVWALDGAIVLMLFAAVRPRSLRGLALSGAAALVVVYLFQGHAWLRAEEGNLGQTRLGYEVWLREAVALGVFFVAAARSKSSVGLGLTLLLLFWTHQAVRHVRHLPLLGITLAPVMAATLADWVRGTVGGWDWMWRAGDPKLFSVEAQERLRERRFALAQVCAFALLTGLTAFYLFAPEEGMRVLEAAKSSRALSPPERERLLDRNRRLLAGEAGPFDERGAEPGAYPKAAVDFLIARDLPGRLFNGGNYAGYLIWRLSPERYKVFTDNRYDVYGGAFIEEEQTVLGAWVPDAASGAPGWEEVLARWEVKTLFIPVRSRLHEVLLAGVEEGDTAWKRVWDDGGFSIWTLEEARAGSAERAAR